MKAFGLIRLRCTNSQIKVFQNLVREENQTAKDLMCDLNKDLGLLHLEKKAKTKCLASSLLNSVYLRKRLEGLITRHFLHRWRFAQTKTKITENALTKIIKLNNQHTSARFSTAYFLIAFFKRNYQRKLKVTALKTLAYHFIVNSRSNQLICDTFSPFRSLLDYSSRTDPRTDPRTDLRTDPSLSQNRLLDNKTNSKISHSVLEDISNSQLLGQRVDLSKLAYISSTRKSSLNEIERKEFENKEFTVRGELTRPSEEISQRSQSAYKLSNKTITFLKKINQRERSVDEDQD